MKSIVVGHLDRVLGVVSLNAQEEWQLTPQDGTSEELQSAIESVFARFRRRQKKLTRSQFLQKFYEKTGAPALAYATGSWAKRTISPALQSLIQNFIPQDDPMLVELHRRRADVLARASVGRMRA